MAHTKNKCPDLVSIIIPIYNTGAYLRETLDSCLNQTYTNLEILAMDDNSNDPETLEILETYSQKDPRVKVIRSNENHGVTYGRNKGVEMCQGKYFCFLDHDDLLADNFVEKLRKAIIDYKVDMAESTFQAFIDSDRESYGDDYRLSYLDSHTDAFEKRKHDVVVFKRKDIISTGSVFVLTKLCWAKLFITDVYRKAGLRFDDVRYGEDIDWSIRVFTTLDSFVSVRFIGLKYRLHPEAGSAGSKGFFRGMNESWTRVYDFISKRDDLKHLLKAMQNSFLLYNFYAYRLLGECDTLADKKHEFDYLISLYKHCEIDMDKFVRDRSFDVFYSSIWNGLVDAMTKGKPEHMNLVVSFNSLFNPDDPDLAYTINLWQLLNKFGLGFDVITTNANQDLKPIDSLKNYAKENLEFIKARKQAEIKDERNIFSFNDQVYTTVHGGSAYTIQMMSPQQGGASSFLGSTQALRDTVNFAALVSQACNNPDRSYKNVIFIGRNKLTEDLGSNMKSNQRKIHVVLNSELTPEEIASGQVTPSSWADVTVALGKPQWLLPPYERVASDFSQREYVTLLYPDCEHGSALAVKLIMLLKQRMPEQKFMFVQKTHDDLTNQLKLVHNSAGAGLFTLKPDLSNLKISRYPSEFSKIWSESKVILMLSPQHPNSHGLTLEALYNQVPVLATQIANEPALGLVNVVPPQETAQDPTCLPDDESIMPLVEGLEQLLKLSEADIKQRCDQAVEQYPQEAALHDWLKVLDVEL